MERSASPAVTRSLKVSPVLLVVLVGAVGIAAVAAVAGRSSKGRAAPDEPGRVAFGLDLPPESRASSVGYLVRSARGEVLASGTTPVKQRGTPLSFEVLLPAGTRDTVTLFAQTSGSAGGTVLLGTHPFDVAAGRPSRVELGRLAVAPSGAAVAVSAVGALAGGTGTVAGSPKKAVADCRACELSSERGRCDPELLTATFGASAGSDAQSWGCATLPSAAAGACAALLHCLNTTDCAGGGAPVMGCYCGAGTTAVACLAGQGISGACAAQYQAAAVATPGGPSPGATIGELSQFIATWASNPKGPIGLADNIKHCAIEASCGGCGAL